MSKYLIFLVTTFFSFISYSQMKTFRCIETCVVEGYQDGFKCVQKGKPTYILYNKVVAGTGGQCRTFFPYDKNEDKCIDTPKKYNKGKYKYGFKAKAYTDKGCDNYFDKLLKEGQSDIKRSNSKKRRQSR